MISKGHKGKGGGGPKSHSKKKFQGKRPFNKNKDDGPPGKKSRFNRNNDDGPPTKKPRLNKKSGKKGKPLKKDLKKSVKKTGATDNKSQALKKDFQNSNINKNPLDKKSISRPFQKKDFKNTGKKGSFAEKPFPTKNLNKEDGTTEEKPDWSEYKKQHKELREKLKAKKLEENFDLVTAAKKIGEQLRRANLPKDTQEKLTKKFHDLAQKQYSKLIFTHDVSRIIQWQIKYCSEDVRLEIATELKPHIQEMFKSIYAKNIIKTLLKVGSTFVKKNILETCYGNVLRLLSNVVSSSIFEKIYVEVASNDEKNLFKQEFYSDIYKKTKDKNVKTLGDVFKNAPEMKAATLSSVKANLTKILNKNLINSTLIHTALYEYLSICSKDDRSEMIVMVRDLIAELSQTRDGSKAANLCIWHGNNKDRKLIMKSLKEHIKDISTSEHGHLMIIALMDCVDDTVLLKKILLQEILNNVKEIALNEYGRLVILYIVARRDTHYFHPKLIEYLKEGDDNATSKKPADLRAKELLDNSITTLLQSIAEDVKTWLSTGIIQLTTFAILKASHGDQPRSAFEAISKFVIDPESKLEKDLNTFVAVEESGLHMILKKLIQMDSLRIEAGELTFGKVFLEYLTPEAVQHLVNSNKGCFLLITLIEKEPEEIVTKVKAQLKKIQITKSQMSKGSELLLKKL